MGSGIRLFLIFWLLKLCLSDEIVQKDLCPKGFIHLNESCYHFSNTKANWIGAKRYCDRLNASLISIESMDELYHVKQQIYHLHQFRDVAYWTSGTDAFSPGEFLWMSTMKKVDIHDWCHGEPSTYSYYNCLQIWNWEGENCWYKWSCTKNEYRDIPLSPLCEFDPTKIDVCGLVGVVDVVSNIEILTV